MTDVLGGVVLLMGAISLTICAAHYIRVGIQRAQRRKRSAWYQVDTARNKQLDFRDYQGHFAHSERRDYLREFAEISAFHRRQAD